MQTNHEAQNRSIVWQHWQKKPSSFPLVNSGADNIPGSHRLKENGNKKDFF